MQPPSNTNAAFFVTFLGSKKVTFLSSPLLVLPNEKEAAVLSYDSPLAIIEPMNYMPLMAA